MEASTALAPRVPALRFARYALVPTYALASFVAAFLVFQVEPMAAKMVLPLFGGAASVWATALVFFQAVLLLGYLYAHVSVRLLGPRRQAVVHAGVLLVAALALPVGRGLSPPEGHSPQLWLLVVLAAAVGAPFFAITSAAPLLQRWLSETAHPAAKDPYFLYAASNAGSLLGLLAYPLLVEPRLSLDRQAAAWSVGYATFIGLAVCCAAAMFAYARSEESEHGRSVTPALAWRTRLRWTAMAFVPSSLLLGATTHITTDIASVPLVWVVPLAVYLLTFVVAFSRAGARGARVAATLLPGAVVLVIASLLGVFHLPIAGSIALHVTTLALVGVLAHGRLAGERPPADRLTEFYLLLSVGGVLGGCFNALIAPRIFDAIVEYPLVLALALLLRPARPAVQTRSRRARAIRDLNVGLVFTVAVIVTLAVATDVAGSGRTGQQLALGASTLATLVFARQPVRFALVASALLGLFVLSQSSGNVERTFYGVIRVTQTSSERLLIHGNTVHGIQSLDPRYRSQPLSYYGRRGPAGDAFQALQAEKGFRRVSVVGLGVGSLAAYDRPGQTFTFYEIDPAVVRVASDPSLFTYLSDARGAVHVVVGDGRISLQHSRNGTEDMVVLDAFNSDSIPVHLMTREAFQLYMTKLNRNGVLLVHVTNRYLDLAPVVGAIARDLGLHAVTLFHEVGPVRLRIGEQPSQWIALARNEPRLRGLERRHWSPLRADPGERAWTDDFSNIVSAIKWTS